jgi:hypothetical protein
LGIVNVAVALGADLEASGGGGLQLVFGAEQNRLDSALAAIGMRR